MFKEVVEESLSNLYDLGVNHTRQEMKALIEGELEKKKFGENKEFDAGFAKALEIILEKI